jgi:hypothetical protein
MKSVPHVLALGLLAAAIAGGNVVASAEANGFHRGNHGSGNKFHGFRFGLGHHKCWRFGKWVCGSRRN